MYQTVDKSTTKGADRLLLFGLSDKPQKIGLAKIRGFSLLVSASVEIPEPNGCGRDRPTDSEQGHR